MFLTHPGSEAELGSIPKGRWQDPAEANGTDGVYVAKDLDTAFFILLTGFFSLIILLNSINIQSSFLLLLCFGFSINLR